MQTAAHLLLAGRWFGYKVVASANMITMTPPAQDPPPSRLSPWAIHLGRQHQAQLHSRAPCGAGPDGQTVSLGD